MSFHRDNHYVPCLYLRHFAGYDDRLFTYRTLVANARVHQWKRQSVAAVAYRAPLYTRIIGQTESDEIERWLDHDFESPAAEALNKATADERLTESDWFNLVRFLAAQDVRTPARLIESIQRGRRLTPGILESSIKDVIRNICAGQEVEAPIRPQNVPYSGYIPLRVTTEIDEDEKSATLKADTVVGRAMWLFEMRHILTKTVNVLHTHRWTILRCPDDLAWPTSDDPVIKLNICAGGRYAFDGGWGRVGTAIFLPLGPHHLLFTTIGLRPPIRGTIISHASAEAVTRMIAEHAHRFVFAASPIVNDTRTRHYCD